MELEFLFFFGVTGVILGAFGIIRLITNIALAYHRFKHATEEDFDAYDLVKTDYTYLKRLAENFHHFSLWKQIVFSYGMRKHLDLAKQVKELHQHMNRENA